MVFMTLKKAKEIVRADRIGTHDLAIPGNRCMLANAQNVIAAHKKRISSQHTEHDKAEAACGMS